MYQLTIPVCRHKVDIFLPAQITLWFPNCFWSTSAIKSCAFSNNNVLDRLVPVLGFLAVGTMCVAFQFIFYWHILIHHNGHFHAKFMWIRVKCREYGAYVQWTCVTHSPTGNGSNSLHEVKFTIQQTTKNR